MPGGGQEIGNFQVNIQAKITGYQSSIENLKKQLAVVGENTDIGKNLSKQIADAEKKLANLSKNSEIQIKTGTGLDKMREQLDGMDRAIANIGKQMQTVTIADIDTSKLDQATQEIKRQIDDLQQQVQVGIGPAFQQVIERWAADSSKSFSTVMDTLKIDPSELNADNFTEVLSSAIEQVRTRVQGLREEISDLTAQRAALGQSKEGYARDSQLSAKDVATSAVARLREIGDTTGLSSTAEVQINHLRDTFNRAFSSMNEEGKQKLNEIFDEMAQSSSLKEFQQKVQELRELLTAQPGLNKTEINRALEAVGGSPFDQLFKLDKFKGVNTEALEQVREVLRDVFGSFEEFKDPEALNAQVESLLSSFSSGSVEGINAVTEAIRLYIETTSKLKGNEAAEAMEKTEEAITSRQAEVDKLNTTNKQANGYVSAGKQEISKLQSVIDEQKKTIDELQKQVDTLAEQVRSGVAGAGVAAEESGDQGLRENAKAAAEISKELDQANSKKELLGSVENIIRNWFSVYAAVRMIGQAFNEIKSTLKDLDKTITEIAIVTNMTQSELWGQMSTYTSMAREYAASISGVYQVSQLYYQQGLQTADVMALTEQTLKMARISGLDYAKATDYMTNAVRSFKMEMTDAQRVVDVYSALAASAATNVEELAVAMSKTASSAEAVGSSFENTSAMMAVMIEATRESSQNIGSALKSIISRYGELKTNPAALVDSEGEELSLNKVDTALQSVGISIHDAQGQFRDFDDVIMDLAKSWDKIDVNTQRYIATIMAGNRQQSRFLALVSNYERLSELSETAANSEDASQMQFLKTLDSIEAKSQQVQTGLQSLYTSAGLEQLYKGILDMTNAVIGSLNEMTVAMNNPIGAIATIGTRFYSLASIARTVFQLIKGEVVLATSQTKAIGEAAVADRVAQGQREVAEHRMAEGQMTADTQQGEQDRTNLVTTGVTNRGNARRGEGTAIQGKQLGALALNISSIALSIGAANLKNKNDEGAQRAGGFMSAGSSALSGAAMGTMILPGWGTAIGGVLGGLMGVWENWNVIIQDTETKLRNATKAAEEANNAMLMQRNSSKSLQSAVQDLQKLYKAQYDSVEAQEAYLEASNALADQYPELIQYYDESGNAIINLTAASDMLAQSLAETTEKTIAAAGANYKRALAQNNQEEEENEEKYHEVTNTGSMKQALTEMMTRVKFGDNGEVKFTQYGEETSYSNGLSLLQSRDVGTGQTATYEQLVQDNSNLISNLTGSELILLQGFYSLGDDVGEFSSWYQSKAAEIQTMTTRGSDSARTVGLSLQTFAEALGVLDSSANTGTARLEASARNGIITTLTSTYNEAKRASNGNDAAALTQQAGNVFYEAMQEYAINSWNQYVQDVLGGQVTDEKQLTQWLTDNGNFSDISTVMVSEYSRIINEGKQAAFDTIMASRDQVSRKEFERQLTDELGITDQRIIAAYTAHYEGLFDVSQLEAAIGNREDSYNKTIMQGAIYWGQLDKLSSGELQSILQKYDEIDGLMSSGQLTEKQGEEYLRRYLTAWDNFNQISDYAIQQQTEEMLRLWDGSREGLETIRQSLIDAGANVDDDAVKALDELIKSLPINFNTLLQTLYTNIGKATKDFNTDIGKLAKGVSADEAVELANKYGMQLSDFQLDYSTGLFAISNISDLTQRYFTSLDNQWRQLETAYEQTINAFDQNPLRTGYLQDLGNTTQLSLKYTPISTILNTLQEEEYEALGLQRGSLEGLLTEFENDKEAADKTFSEWLGELYGAQIQAAAEALSNTKARGALQLGNVTQFVTEALSGVWDDTSVGELTIQAITESIIQTGSVSEEAIRKTLSEKGMEESAIDKIVDRMNLYTNFVSDTLGDVTENTISQAIGVLKSGKNVSVPVTQENRAVLGQLLGRTLGEDVTTVELTQAALGDANAYNRIREIIYATLSNDKEALEKALGELEATKPTDYDTLNSIISAGEDGFGEVLRSQAIGLGLDLTPEWDEAIKAYRINPDELREVIKNDANLGRKQKNALLASLDKQTRETSKFSAFKAISEDYTSIEEEAIEQLANALDQDYDVIKDIFDENGDGTYRANLSQLMALRDRLSLAGNKAAVEVITKVIDSYIEELGKIGTIQTQGYTKLSDMRAIASQFGESINSIFRWDDELRAYVLNTSGIVAQAQYMKQQLSSVTGKDQEIINQLINGQKQQLADNIDAMGYLTAIQTGNQGIINKAANEFARAVDDYWAFCLGLGEGITVNARDLQQLIANGGRDAILAAGYIASLQGKELSGEDIEKFYRGQVQPFINATEQLTLSVGSVIDETTAGILQQAGYGIQLLGGGKAVITSAGNLVDAQKALYDTLKETNEATLAELNNLYAQYYSSSKGNFDALSNAGGMSYDTLAQIATDAGLTLEALLSEEFSDLFEDIGGKIQVKNFYFFAKEILGITDTTSQAYVDAFRSYNDTIISGLNARKNNIKSEIEAISQAKDGELINVGQFYSAFMNEPTVNRYALNNELSRAGAIISNGILELGTANISSILEIFKRYGKQANLSDIDLKVINDAIISYVNTSINNVSNLISKQKSGYTDIGEMSSLAETYGMTVSEMFKWDNDLNAYVVSQQGIGQAVLIARQNLDSLDRNSDEYAAALRTLQAQGRQLADNIDFTRLVNSIGTTDYGDAILDFEEAVENYNAFLAASGKQIRLNTADLIKAAQRGGKDAVAAAKAIAKTTGKELTGEDIEGIYRQGANRINQALDQIQLSIGSVIDQSTVQLLGLSGKVESIGGGKYVITSTINMVDAYLKLHNLMQQNDASTLTEINALQVKILTEMGGRSKATIDALGSAASMSYDTLAAIAEDVGMDLMTMLDKLGTSVEYLGGDQIRITDFRKFAKEVGFEDTTSELYIEALSAYNDSLIEAETKTTESIISEITAVSEAHVGDKVNVSHLYSLFGKDIPVTFIWRLSQFGADIKNGILTINSTEYLGQIVALLQEAAEATGQLTEREIAELQDAAQNLITAITDSIKQGIEGTLTNVQKVDLKESLKQYGVSLDDSAFVKTVNGWQLTQEAATQVYLTMREIDALQGSLVLDALRESLVEANGEFSTMSTMMRSLAQDNVISGRTLERRRRQNAVDQRTYAELSSLNGNVDMFTRPHVRNEDGTYSTVHTMTYGGGAAEEIRNFPYVLNVTPITQDGRELSPDEVDDYIYELIDQAEDIDEVLRLDASESGKQLIIEWSQINTENLTNEQLLEAANTELERMGEHAEHIHEISDQMEPLEAREIAALQEQRDLLQEMAMLRATSKDEGFAFMDAKLPEAMENPLTYAENWGKAIDILTKRSSGTKKGFIDARDWYNIVNEMNNIAAVSGQSLTLFGETLSGKATDAANLIEKGFNNLKSIDGGKMQVDLRAAFGSLGSAFEQGATDAQGSITKGIHEMAKAQIAMLDGLIAMLETVVAMEEAFEGLKAADDGKLEFDELFDDLGESFKPKADLKIASERLLAAFPNLQDPDNPLNQIKINGLRMSKLLEDVKSDVEFSAENAQGFSAALSAFYQAMQSGNYDLDNIYESAKRVLQESGAINGSVSIDVGTTTLYLTGNVITQIDWNSTQVKEALKNAYNGRSKNGKSPKEQAEAAMEALSKDPGSLLGAGHENDLKFVLQTNTDVTYNAKTKTYTVDGHPFTDEKEAYKALLLKQTSNKTKITVDSSGKLTGAVIEGEAGAKVEMTINSEGNISYKYVGPGGDYGEGATPQEAIRNYYSAHPNQLPDNLSLDDVVHKTSVELGVESSTGITFGEIDEKTGKVVERKPTAEESRKAMALLNDPTLTTYQDLRDKADELGLPIHIDTSLQGPFDIATLQSLAEKLGGEYKLEAKTLSLNVDTSNIPEGWVKLIEGQKLEIATDLESLNDVTTEGLQAVIDALTQVYDKAVQLQNFDWADLKNKLNIFGPSGEGEGEDGETTQPGFVDVTINPIAEKGLLDLIYGETLERNLVVNVQKKGDNLNPTQTENNDNKNQKDNKESNDNSGAALGEANTGGLQAAVDAVNSIATDKGAAIQNTTDALNALPDQSNLIKRLSGSIDKIQDRSGRIDNLVQSINNLPSNKEIALEISMKIKATADVKFNTEGNTPSGPPGAKGNIEISNEQASVESLNPSKKKIKITGKKKSKAKGTSALAGGTNKTLMGELGPELVVTDNMYHVVGESGAEFVDLPNDAIVFNHLLTKKLLKNGHAGRGKPITNERNAVAFAKGNGPAMASAAQALAALKQLRAMWASMLNASAKDLGSQAGRGGGGGGKEDNDKYKQPTNVTAEIQRWYNWLRQIDRIEQDITYQEALQKKYESDRIANGLKIYQTQKAQYDLLGEEIKRNQKLAELQKSWYDNKRAELAASSYGKIFTYDENGLQQYVGTGKPGSGLGLDILENLTRRNVKGEYTGHAVSAKEQLKYLASVGFKLNDLIYNDDGTKVAQKVTQSLAIQRIQDDESSDDEIFTQMMDNFWNNVDGWRDELDSLYDSYREQLTNIEENQTKQYEIIQKFVENELDVENKLLEAIEAREQAVIDKLTEQKEALQKSTDRFIKGLNDQLDKEKQMQEDNKKDEELTKLQRQLAILQRSGGSASQIKSLQDQIASKQQDAYYDGRQEEIDAIKDATDKQLEKLDKQIELLTETLEYQKENGLFWNEVRELMAGPEDVATAFYDKYVTSKSGQSALQQSEDVRSFKESFQKWIGWREDKDKQAEKQAEMEDIANYETYAESNNKYLKGLTEDERSSAITRAETAAEEAKNQYLEDHKGEEGAEEGAKAAAAKAYNESLRTSFVNSEQNQEGREEFEEGYDTWLKNRYAKNGDEDITQQDVFKNNQAAFKENVEAKYLQNLQDGMDRKAALEDAINYGEEQLKQTGTEDAKAAEVQAKLSAKAAVYKINEAKGTAKKTKTTIAKGTLQKFTRAKLAKVGKKKIKFLYAEPIGWIAASNVVDGTELYNKLKNAQDIADASEQIDALSNPLGEEAGENQYYDAAITRKIALSGLSKKQLKFSATKLQDKSNGEMISPLKYGNTIQITDVQGLKFNKKGKISKLSKVNVSSLNGSELQQSEWVKANKTIIKKLNAMFPNSDFKNYLKYLNKYENGGLVDYTGLARVDGTPGRPEAFLNAEQTAFLKNDLLGHSSNSLMSIVSSLQDSINGTAVGNSNISNNNNNDNVVIENVDVTFEAGTISSDYDARRAGELFKEELVKMARKAGDRSVTRR